MYYIYQFFNILNGKIYIGKTNNIKNRLSHYNSVIKGGKEKYPKEFQAIHSAIKKYKNAIEFTVIQSFFSEKEALDAEKYWIHYFQSNNYKYGYNLTMGGEGTSGRIVSEETRAKLSISLTGKITSEDAKIKIGNANRGKKQSEQTIIKRSLTLKGRKLSEEHKKILLNSNIGRIVSENTRNKISENIKSKNLVGEKNPNSSIKNEEAIEIRELYATGKFTQKKLAKMFNLDQTTISNIVRYKSYRIK